MFNISDFQISEDSKISLVSRSQTTIFAQGRYRFQYKRPARGAYTESDNAPVRK